MWPAGDRLFRDRRHVDCAIDLAERAARAAGADWIRWDVFLSPSSPQHCVLNENSLSSGERYVHHGDYLVKIWLEPYHKKWIHKPR